MRVEGLGPAMGIDLVQTLRRDFARLASRADRIAGLSAHAGTALEPLRSLEPVAPVSEEDGDFPAAQALAYQAPQRPQTLSRGADPAALADPTHPSSRSQGGPGEGRSTSTSSFSTPDYVLSLSPAARAYSAGRAEGLPAASDAAPASIAHGPSSVLATPGLASAQTAPDMARAMTGLTLDEKSIRFSLQALKWREETLGTLLDLKG